MRRIGSCRYNAQIDEMQKEIKRHDELKGEAKNKSEREIEKLKKSIESLNKEKTSQQKEKEKFDQFLEEQKSRILDKIHEGFFRPIREGDNNDSAGNIPFLQHCILPRLRLSPEDAIYSVKFLKVLMNLKNLQFLDQLEFRFSIIKALFPAVFSCSEYEAFNLGLFFKELLGFTEFIHDPAKIYAVGCKVTQEANPGKKYDKSHLAEVNMIKLVVLLFFGLFTETIDKALYNSTDVQVHRD